MGKLRQGLEPGHLSILSQLTTLCTVLLCVSIAALAAFALSRYRFRGSKLIFVLCMGGMMLSPQVTLIPLYKIIQALRIHDTYWAMILPYAAYRMPITLMLIRSYFLSIPKEIEESATIDGCRSFDVLWRIFLPISKPILLTCAILVAYYAWNEFMFSMIFIDSKAFKTIPSGLMVFRDALSTDYALLFAGLTNTHAHDHRVFADAEAVHSGHDGGGREGVISL